MSGMNTHILISDDLTTTSLIVADAFGKQHAKVLRAIESLQIPAEYRKANFGETEITRPSPLNGAPIKSKAYRLTRDGFALLVMGFTGARAMEWKIKFLDAFNAMEAKLRQERLVAVKAHTRRLPPRPATLPTPESGPAKGEIMAAQKRRELIREHTTKLLALVAAEAPAEATRVSLHLWSDWGPDPDANTHCGISANATRREWKADQRMPQGGLFTDKDVAHWLPGKGESPLPA